MAISITWGTRVIYVPKADLALVQVGPPEIRELDIDAFRLALKSLEAGEAGMGFPDTHNHYPPITVGGVTLGRVVEIINGYTVTFEDGQYAVNLVGANSNIADVANLNQVSIRAANSAGLIYAPGSTVPTAEEVADAVWDEATAGHVAPGSAGAALVAPPSAGTVADAVWDEAAGDHSVPGSTGEALVVTAPTAGDVADAVWDEPAAGHVAAGSLGALMQALARLPGLAHENAVMDQTVYDADKQLLSARWRTYDTKAHADAARAGGPGTDGLIAVYTINSSWLEKGKMADYIMTLEP